MSSPAPRRPGRSWSDGVRLGQRAGGVDLQGLQRNGDRDLAEDAGGVRQGRAGDRHHRHGARGCRRPRQDARGGHGLTAFDSANGQVVWTCKDFNGTVIGTSRKMLVGFDKAVPEIVTIDMERGDVVARAKTPGAVMVKPDAFENGNLYVLSGSGLVAKFVPLKR